MKASDNAELLNELTESNDFFDMLVDMIPAKLYLKSKNTDGFNPKYHKHSKEDSKESRRAQAKQAKRRKLDPNEKTGTLAAVSKNNNSSDTQTVLLPKAPSTPKAKDSQGSEETPAVISPNASRIERLKAKLQAKVEHLRGKRPDASGVSKRAARRAAKERRKEEAKRKKKQSPTSTNSRVTASTPTVADSENATVSADLAKLDFGRLSGLDDPAKAKEHYQKTNKALANLNKPKNLEKLVAQAEAKQAERLALEQDPDKKEKLEKLQWSDAFHEADGQRVKDDPKKLKKKLAQKKAHKKQSQKAWNSRLEKVKRDKKDRQQIRQHNLQQRRKGGQTGANLSRDKINTDQDGTDSGRRLSRAGFEGRKQEFLNKSGKQ